jgi:hypothetical protein
MFLNSDCVVTDPGWMLEMGRALIDLTSQNVKMVAAKSNNPGPSAPQGMKQEDSSRVRTSCWRRNFFRFTVRCATETCSHTSAASSRSTRMAATRTRNCRYRMRFYGYKQAVCGNTWIFHEGEATFKALIEKNPEVLEVLEKNRQTCVDDVRKLYAGRK